MSRRARMRAAVLHGREDVRIEAVERPRPAAGEVLLRTQVALTCGTDAKVFRRGYHARMLVPPALFGHELAGVVEEVGDGVEGFAPGQAVVTANSAPCGTCDACREGRPSLCADLLFWNGAYAELALIPARIVSRNLLPLPPGLSFRRAAMAEPLACVVRGVEACRIRAGQTVAVIGAGSIGLMFLALCRARGARVVVAGRRREGLERALRLGATAAVSPTLETLAAALREHGRGGPDVVIEAVGNPDTAQAALQAVRRGGIVNVFGGCPADSHIRIDVARMHYEELTLLATFHHTPGAFRESLRLIASGVVEPLDLITAEAPLAALPRVLATFGRPGSAPKTAILPAGRETAR
jgi:L-iditol 2-dehydrogenase